MRRPLIPRKLAPCLRALPALAGLALLTGCWLDGRQSTFDVKGPVARAQLDLFMVTVYVTAANPTQTGELSCFILLDNTQWKTSTIAAPKDGVACAGIVP